MVCDVVIAEFVWGVQRCYEPAVAYVSENDLRWGVCLSHCQGARNAGHMLTSLLP